VETCCCNRVDDDEEEVRRGVGLGVRREGFEVEGRGDEGPGPEVEERKELEMREERLLKTARG